MLHRVKLWWTASGGMILLFLLSCVMDAARYSANSSSSSSPLWIYLLVRALQFLLPALLFAAIALFLQWKKCRQAKTEKKTDALQPPVARSSSSSFFSLKPRQKLPFTITGRMIVQDHPDLKADPDLKTASKTDTPAEASTTSKENQR